MSDCPIALQLRPRQKHQLGPIQAAFNNYKSPQKAFANSLFAKYVKKLKKTTGIIVILDNFLLQTTRALKNEGIDLSRVHIVERDLYTFNWIVKIATSRTVVDLTTHNVPTELISEIGNDLVTLPTNNIHHASIDDFLSCICTHVVNAIFLDYMCTFEGANVNQKYSGTINDPKRDINLLLSKLPANHEFVIALTFCVGRGTPSGVTPEMAIKSENKQMAQIFSSNDIVDIEHIVDSEQDIIGWEYVQEGGKVRMHFTCYRAYKLDVIEID